MSDGKRKRNDNTLALSVGVGIAAVTLWITAGLVQAELFTDWPTRGQFGDMFGSVNSLFSGLAFAGVIVAIILQRQELQLQREELEATRQELGRSAAAHEEARDLQRRRLYERARYESWLRAANAIEAFRYWLAEWSSHLHGYYYDASGPNAAMDHWADPRRAEFESVLKSTDQFFAGVHDAFGPFLDEANAILAKVIGENCVDRVGALYIAVGQTCDEWRKRVHEEVFADLIVKPGDPGRKEGSNE